MSCSQWSETTSDRLLAIPGKVFTDGPIVRHRKKSWTHPTGDEATQHSFSASNPAQRDVLPSLAGPHMSLEGPIVTQNRITEPTHSGHLGNTGASNLSWASLAFTRCSITSSSHHLMIPVQIIFSLSFFIELLLSSYIFLYIPAFQT